MKGTLPTLRIFGGMMCMLAFAPTARSNETSPTQSSAIFQLQFLLTFDCLDGVTINASDGSVTLFGHIADASNPRHIAYYDYLATALDATESPSINLVPNPGFHDAERKTIDSCSKSVLDKVTSFHDSNGVLNPNSTWLLEQLGVAIPLNSTPTEALSLICKASNQAEKATLFHLAGEGLNQGEISVPPSGVPEVCTLLGIASAWKDVVSAKNDGSIDVVEEQDEKNILFLRALGQTVVMEPGRYVSIYKGRRQKGDSPKDALLYLAHHEWLDDLESRLSQGLHDLCQARREVPIPPWMLDSIEMNGLPSVHPVFENVEEDSWMARTLYQGDIALKSIVSLGPLADPELETLVPSYQSERRFMQARGRLMDTGELHHQRAQIVPGPFKITESDDGKSLRFESSPMNIVVKNVTLNPDGTVKDEEDPDVEAYQKDISSRYEDLARVFPTLHKVEEAAKVVAIARWVQRKGFSIKFPVDGRMKWQKPESIPAIVTARFEIAAREIHCYANLSGGVELAPEKNWEITKGTVNPPQNDIRLETPIQSAQSSDETALRGRIKVEGNPMQKSALELQLAVTLVDHGDRSGAAAAIDRAIILNPNNPSLLLLSAQAHADAGDATGAAATMKIYLATDPQNAPAERMLATFQNQAAHPIQAPTASGPALTTPGSVQPFVWNSPVSRAVYAMDERAPELPDIHMDRFKPSASTLPPAPPIPDCIAYRPEMVALKRQRSDLIKAYAQASPEEAPKIVEQIKKVDKAVVKKTVDLSVSFDDPPSTLQGQQPSPQHQP